MSVYSPSDWMSIDSYLKHLAHGQPLTDDMVERFRIKLTRHILDSQVFFMRNLAYCLDKQTDEVTLTDPWFGQTGLDYIIESQRQQGYAQRVIEIKPRQVGWTQALITRALWTCLHPNKHSLIFIPDADVGRRTMARVSTILLNLPQWFQPMIRTNNVNLIEFENPDPRRRSSDPGLQSSFGIVVPSDFRGATNLNMVVLSEYAKYYKSLDVNAFVESLQNGMGESVNTCMVIDTTPIGHDDYYEPKAQEACARNPELVKRWYSKERRTREDIINGWLGVPDDPSDWVPHFTRWVDHESYTTKDDTPRGELPCMSEEVKDLMLHGPKSEWPHGQIGTVDRYGNDEEIWLQKDHHATLGQLFFRRTKINKSLKPDWRSKLIGFRQEMAIDHNSCFVSYGSTPFDIRCLDALFRMVRDPYARGVMRSGSDGIYLDTDYHSDWEEVRLWTTPTGSESYLIAVDVAHAYENVQADDTVAQVFRRRDNKQVAIYQCKVPPHKIIQQLYLLYRFYNDALLAVETEDGIAYDIVRKLYDMGATNQYEWKRIDRSMPDPGTNPFLGWETNPRTRGIMQESLVKLISNINPDGSPAPEIIIRDMETYRQIENLERDPHGHIKGSGKTRDDCAVACMIYAAVNNDPFHSFQLPSKTEQRQEMNSLMSAIMRDDGHRTEDGIGHLEEV